MQVLGQEEVARRLLSLKSRTFGRIVEAIEKNAVRMAMHARSGHNRGSNPHARDRYENRTANLTNSIFPGGANSQGMQFEEISERQIVGLFGVDSSAPGAVMEYAQYVDQRYPFIWPAAMAYKERLIKDVRAAAKP